ncbi:cytochrome P450 4V2-like [Cotesia glomerata]|uniref:cytochrome P450 4V2-like n=1 Tax=Cotesia glomerata TaxID=32391 RepID=UPI001D0059D6|nr:cytochrome P450 4V2-like [Cotesia glomerata]
MDSLLSTLFATALIIVLVIIMIYHYNRLDLYKAGYKIPGLWPVLPIIGNAHLFFGSVDKFISRIILLDEFEFSPIRFWLGNKLCVVLFDPDQMKAVFRSPKTIEKDGLYKILHPFIGTGLLTAPANKWKIRRKLIVPAFHPKILESFVGVMNEQSNILVKILESQINKDEFELFPYISRCTLNIICETAMGVSVNVQTSRDSTYVQALNRLKAIFAHRMLKIWLHFDIIFNLTKLSKVHKDCINFLHNHTNNVIEKKRKLFSEIKNSEDDVTQTGGSKRKIYLDLLMEMSNEGSKLTNEDLRDEVTTLITAANDTTAIANTFFIYMLANFPDVQEKCYEELVEIFGTKTNDKKEIEIKDLNRMKYLDRVIKETMRLFPPVPVLIREVSDDLDIGGGYTLPKGTAAILSVSKLHRSANFWEDPLRFNPDRFLAEQVALRHPFAYVPFSAGPRGCIGWKYGMMSMKILLATLIRNYVFIKDKHVSIEDIKVNADIFIKTFEPISVKIKLRQ